MALSVFGAAAGKPSNLLERSGLYDSPLEGDGFELPVPGRIYSAAMRSQVISRCSSLSPVRRSGGPASVQPGDPLNPFVARVIIANPVKRR
jgi:hypothetical protein